MYAINHGKFYKNEKFKFWWIAACCIHFFFNLYFKYLSLELFFFGYIIYLLPILFHHIFIFIGIFFIFLSLDTQSFIVLPYKFCGMIGELILILDKIILLFLISVIILLLIYLLFKLPKKTLEKSTSIKKENIENKLLKICNSDYFNLEIIGVKYGAICDFYEITTQTNNLFVLIQDICLENNITCRLARYADCDLLEVNKKQVSTFRFHNLIQHNIFELCVLSPFFGYFPLSISNLICCKRDFHIDIVKDIVNSIYYLNKNIQITIISDEEVNLPNCTFVECGLQNEVIEQIAKEIDLRQTNFIQKLSYVPIVIIDLTNNDLSENSVNLLKDLRKKANITIFKFIDSAENCFKTKEFFKTILVGKTNNKYESVLSIGKEGCEYLTDNKYDFLYLDKSTNEIYRVYLPQF